MKWYAIDYVSDCECELVYNDQLYLTEEAAQAACDELARPDYFEVNWYQLGDLAEVYNTDNFEITDDLRVVAYYE